MVLGVEEDEGRGWARVVDSVVESECRVKFQ